MVAGIALRQVKLLVLRSDSLGELGVEDVEDAFLGHVNGLWIYYWNTFAWNAFLPHAHLLLVLSLRYHIALETLSRGIDWQVEDIGSIDWQVILSLILEGAHIAFGPIHSNIGCASVVSH